ncbi:unnamed protein product, partial [Rotaria magnacalcarata]
LHLKSKLLEFLCAIRAKLIIFRTIEELKNTLDQIDSSTGGQLTPVSGSSMSLNSGDGSQERTQSASENIHSIGFSHLLTNPTSQDNLSSPGAIRRPASTSSMQLVQKTIRIHLRSYRQPYDELKMCEQKILAMIQKQFGTNLDIGEEQQLIVNTLWSSDYTKQYASQIHCTDKLLRDLKDLYESFCQ